MNLVRAARSARFAAVVLWLAAGVAAVLGVWNVHSRHRLAGAPPALHLGIHGCWEVEQPQDRRELICSLDPLIAVKDQPIQILVRSATDAELSVDCDGCRKQRCVASAGAMAFNFPMESSAEVAHPALICWELQWERASAHVAELELRSRSLLLGRQTIQLPLPARTTVDAVQQRWRELGDRYDQGIEQAGSDVNKQKSLQMDHAKALEQLIRESDEQTRPQTTGPLQDRLTILQARIRNEWLRVAMPDQTPVEQIPAKFLGQMQTARQLAKQHGWLRSQADLSEALAWLFRYQEHALENIQALLDEPDWPRLLPLQNSHCVRLLLGAALGRQDVRLLARYTQPAIEERLAMPVQNGRDDAYDLLAQALLLATLSQSDEDVRAATQQLKIAAESARQRRDACLAGFLLGNVGWAQLLRLEFSRIGDDPSPVLREAIELLSKECPAVSRNEIDNLWLNIARAHLVVGLSRQEPHKQVAAAQVAQVQSALSQVAKGQRPALAVSEFELQLVQAGLHVLQGEPEHGEAELMALSQRAMNLDSPLASWLVSILYAEFWRLQAQPEVALQKFREADAALLSLQRRVPIQHSYRTVLSRYRYPSQRGIALAIELGRNAESLTILRQELQITHGLTTRPWSLDPAAPAVRQARQRYDQRRRHFEARIIRPSQLGPAECDELARDKEGWLDALDAIYQQQIPALFTPPALQPGEFLLACEPVLTGSMCWGGTADSVEVVSSPASQISEQILEEQVLPKFAAQIARAEKILVLAHGALTRLEIEAVKFLGKPLGTLKPIRYTADRPASNEVRPPAEALLVLNPEGDLNGRSASFLSEQLKPSLAELRVHLRSAAPISPLPPTWSWGEALSTGVYSDLQASDLYLYFGHVDPMPCPTQTRICAEHGAALAPDSRMTAMCLSQHTTVTTSDVLAAPRIPRRAYLLGCASADRNVTTPQELIGLAQAFAVRGSEVLAFARPIRESLAQEVLCGIAQAPSLRFDLDKAGHEIRKRLYRGERCADRGRWHVPVCPPGNAACATPVDWSALRTYGP